MTNTNTILHLYGDYLAPNLFDFPIYEFDPSIKNSGVFAWEKTEIDEDGISLPVILEHIVKEETQKKEITEATFLRATFCEGCRNRKGKPKRNNY
ncbi:MAG: hypothetical protein HC892_21780 [Saprospiraceae bacterium]|nr:hypothetical protein [Saprospiraceae bacterium]